MVLGALIDAGLSLEALIEELNKPDLPGLELTQERAVRQSIAGTHVKVHFGGRPIGAEDEHHFVPIVPREEPTGALLRTGASDKHEHHRLEDILSLIEKSRLDKSVQTQSMAIFNRLPKPRPKFTAVRQTRSTCTKSAHSMPWSISLVPLPDSGS